VAIQGEETIGSGRTRHVRQTDYSNSAIIGSEFCGLRFSCSESSDHRKLFENGDQLLISKIVFVLRLIAGILSRTKYHTGILRLPIKPPPI
jgi:hypothetical protein